MVEKAVPKIDPKTGKPFVVVPEKDKVTTEKTTTKKVVKEGEGKVEPVEEEEEPEESKEVKKPN